MKLTGCDVAPNPPNPELGVAPNVDVPLLNSDD